MAITTQERPQRWDQPFGLFMTDQDVERLLTIPEISAIEENKFPAHCSLKGILKNGSLRIDMQVISLRNGKKGDSIEVQSLDTKKKFQAIVIDSRTVKLIL